MNTTKHRAAQVTHILSHIKRIIKNKLPNGLAPVHTQREGRRKEEGRGGGREGTEKQLKQLLNGGPWSVLGQAPHSGARLGDAWRASACQQETEQ